MLQIAFFSNFLNHHQLPFCKAMLSQQNVEFVFVATEPITEDRLQMGYEDMDAKYPFVVRAYLNATERQRAQDIADHWDVVIVGSAPQEWFKYRHQHNKLIFQYSERIFKRGYFRFSPRVWYCMIKNHTLYRKGHTYLLCASAYAAGDFNLMKAYPGKAYKWGYFPEIKKQNIDALIASKSNSDVVNILWAGRFLKWKHPEYAVYAAKRLCEHNIPFEMNIIGNGECYPEIKKYIQDYNLENKVKLIDFQPPEIVRAYMEKANIFLFTSDYGEGWGAVLNEAMNSGCAVVANHAIGSVPFMVDDGKNGIVYENEKIETYLDLVERLVQDKEMCKELGKNAYHTVENMWNANNAADRLIELIHALENGKSTPYVSGPCSVAQPYLEWNMYKMIARAKNDEN